MEKKLYEISTLKEAAMNITTKESRERLAQMVTRLFDHWGLSSAEQCSLLGLAVTSRKTLNR